jgi:tetratricopeptide (TPR) repeat protein
MEQRELQPGVALEVPIVIGELHSYRIALQKNEFFQLVVDQQEADIEVTYYAPDGRRLQRMDCRWYGSEPAPLIAESSGYYRLEIRALRAGKNARYVLRPQPPRAQTQQDAIAIAAVLASTAVKASIKEGTLESKKKGLGEARRAFQLWQETGDRTGEAQTLNSIGFLQEALGQPRNALDSYRQALTIWRAIGDRAGEAEALHDIAAAYSALGDKQQALNYYAQALPLRRETGDHEALAFTLTNMAVVHFNVGEEEKAAGLFAEALPAWRAAANTIGEAQATMGLGAGGAHHPLCHARPGHLVSGGGPECRLDELPRSRRYRHGPLYCRPRTLPQDHWVDGVILSCQLSARKGCVPLL